jgi:hypothetical protein
MRRKQVASESLTSRSPLKEDYNMYYILDARLEKIVLT